jgi:hypothetical protein
MSKLSRRELLKASAVSSSAIAIGAIAPFIEKGNLAVANTLTPKAPNGSAEPLPIRMCKLDLDHPWFYEKAGHKDMADSFWDHERWEKLLILRAEEGYNSIYWWVNPWIEESWQSWFIAHKDYPEARVLSDEQFSRVQDQLNWLYNRAHQLGMRNFQFNHCIVTTKPFAAAHDLKGVGIEGDFRGAEWGDRNEVTRGFTEKTIAELFQTYEALDGLMCPLGDSLPGKRSSWYREAIVPGLRRSGRDPICIIETWQLPFEDFMEDIANKDIYPNTWVNVDFNGENLTDDRPYPIAARWAERGGLPTIYEILDLDFEGNLPFNGPRYAYNIARNLRKVDNCVGFNYWGEPHRDAENYLFRKALAYYGKTAEPYSDEPWVKILAEKFGDADAAQHFLKAYEMSGHITPEVCALVWVPICTLEGRQLSLKYWFLSNLGKNVRIGYYNGTARGTEILPVKYYAWVVAELGEQWVNGDRLGSDYKSPSNEQVYKWELADHPVTPEAHMAKIRQLGERALAEAELAMKTVKTQHDEAQAIYNYMQAYKLLADYYEKKVLTAVSALVYGFGGPVKYRDEAQQLADEVVRLYELAANFMWEKIDKQTGSLKGMGGWEMGNRPPSTMPQLIAAEKQERAHLAEIFHWPPKVS